MSAKSERRFTISHDIPPDRYELSVAWNEAEFVNQGEVGFSVSAAKHLLGDDGQVIEQDVATGQLSVAVRQDPEFTGAAEFRPLLVITFPGREEPFTFPLHDLHDEAVVLDEIPAELFGLGDPVVGCLVRAGLSAVVGQVIQCTRSTTDTVSGFVARMREIGHCLVDNIAGMSARMAGLAMRCIVRAF